MADELVKSDGSRQMEQASHEYWPPQGGDRRWRWGMAVAVVLIALISFFALGRHFTNPETFRGTVEALDAKRDTVMNLMGASTGSSAVISLLPGDAGTPIAEKLVDLSSDFLVVIAAIYLEKYLLTILGAAAFKLLIPIGCVLCAIALFAGDRVPGVLSFRRLGMKLIVFGLATVVVVPASVRVSGMIESTYQTSINETIEAAEQTTEAIENSAGEVETTDTANPLSFLLSMPDELAKLTDSAQNALNNFIEALAVMIVTSCIIPILVLFFFIWIAKLVLGINIDVVPLRRPRLHK